MLSRVPLYDSLAADYDRFVDWKGRLAHELPFFESLFEAHGVQHVLDAACGTGHHAIALAGQGYRVVGGDLSEAMIQRARANASAHGVDVSFVVAGLGGYAALGQTFDAAICLGNSLPHLVSADAVAGALADFAAVLRPGGLLVIQNRNFDRVWARRERFMPPQSHRDAAGEWVFVRFYDYHQETVDFNMLRLRRTEDGWAQDVESTELRPVFRDDLSATLAAVGMGEIACYGSYDGSDFGPDRSGDLISVSKRRG
ncbi:MAG: class I SAM-dependent methyltransferase [Anaerolineae bacterium]